MRKLLKKLTIVMAICMPLGILASTSTFPPKTANAQNESYFFVQTADIAHIDNGVLTMKSVYPESIWFADAPSRSTGSLTLNRYMSLLWDSPTAAFQVNNPNASLSGFIVNPKTEKHERVNLILTLKDAAYDANKNILTYKINKLLYAHSLTAVDKSLDIQQPTLFVVPYICPTCD